MYRCQKQETLAVIENNGRFWVGRNDCQVHTNKCPRDAKGCKSGEGYDLCRIICMQEGHAEVMACKAAGENARGGTLYLYGHTYCCDACRKVMDEHGIVKVVIMKGSTT